MTIEGIYNYNIRVLQLIVHVIQLGGFEEMKKLTIAIAVGIFVLVTGLLCMNSDGKMYQKQKRFESVNDVLIQLENSKLQEIDANGERHETNEFEECLSKRKRLTFSEINFEKIKVEKIEELDQEKKNFIIEDYNKMQQRLSMPYHPSKVEPVRLDIQGTYPSFDDYNSDPIEFIIDMVMVDEGEGMVIDYYVEHNVETGKSKEEGRKVNVKD